MRSSRLASDMMDWATGPCELECMLDEWSLSAGHSA